MNGFGLASQHLGIDVSAVLLIALIVAFAAGLVPGIGAVLSAPESAVRGMAAWFAFRLNRPGRGEKNRRVRGFVVALFFVVLGLAVGGALHGVARSIRDGWIVETAALVFLVARGGATQRMLSVGSALHRKGVAAGRAALAALVPFDTSDLDEHGVSRGAIEYGATSICDGIVGPAVFYLLFGLPGACLYVFVGAAARALATPAPQHISFGAAVRTLDSLLNAVPAPVAGIFLSIGAIFGPGARPFKSIAGMMRRPRTRFRLSQNWTISAAAGALGLALAGPRRYQGVAVSTAWIGDGRARAVRADVIRGTYLTTATSLVAIAAVALVFLLRS